MYKLKITLVMSVITALVTFTSFQRPVEQYSVQEGVRSVASQVKLQLMPEAGFAYRYSFERKINFTGFKPAFEPIQYSGVLEIAIVNSDLNGFKGIASIDGVSLKIEWSHVGNELGLYTQESSSNERIAMLKDLISLWLFPVTEDTIGKYQSVITHVNSTDSVNKLSKQKISYLDSPEEKPKILQSENVLSWNPNLGIPLIVEGSEKTQMQNQIQGESSYRLQLTDISRSQASSLARLNAFQKSTSLTLLNDESEKENLPAYADIRWSELAEKLKHLDQSEHAEQLKIFGELIRALRVGKAKVEEVASLILNPQVLREGTRSQLFKTVVGALASLGTPEAQASILKVYQSPDVSVNAKGSILTSLTTMQRPETPETKEFLMTTMQTESNVSLAHGAGFALSSSSDAARSSSVYQAVSEAWENADRSEQLDTIDMIGNTGNTKFLQKLTDLIQEEKIAETLKAKAVFALRFMHDDQAVQLLALSLNDSSHAVRESALDALEIQSDSVIKKNALAQCALKESNSHLRNRCASLQ